jgi:hypothetical protein
MATQKLKLKVGPHEFEAEGDHEQVMAQLQIWQQLIAASPIAASSTIAAAPQEGPGSGLAPKADRELDRTDLSKMFIHSEATQEISLRYIPPASDTKERDAILMILLGYRALEDKPEILVTWLKAALEKSGLTADRIDRLANPLVNERLLLKRGRSKGGVYQLTNKGVIEATRLAKEMLEQVS